MAVSDHPQGYQCEFIDSVPEDFYCKKCSLVARNLTYTSCCGESYCHVCIADTQQQGKPCLACGEREQNFTTIQLAKYQQRIEGLQAYCSMKGRGCGWSGTIKQLDTHLDPNQDNCQYLDTKCPLNCQQLIPKNRVEQHVAEECVKRDYVCQYCAFKAIYEEVVDTHLPECIYVPLQCPNLCGVTCERDVMEDHIKMCRLEEVACEFSGVGCDERFIREDQEEHTRQNSQKHLTLTATATLNSKQHLQQKFQEQEQKLQDQEQKFQEQEQNLRKQTQKLQQQKEQFTEILQELEQKFSKKFEELEQGSQETSEQQEQKFQQDKKEFKEKLQQLEHNFEKKFQEQEYQYKKLLQQKFTLLQEKPEKNEMALAEIPRLERTFTMTNFSIEKAKDKPKDWKSPAMYTHLYGYKFCIGIDANGLDNSRGKAVGVELWTMQGEYDHQLKWPAEASFTIELRNQWGRENAKCTLTKKYWEKPMTPYVRKFIFARVEVLSGSTVFIEHSQLDDFLHDDTLYFHLTDITVF